MHATFETTVPIFIAILLGYVVLCLAIGAKSVYFKPYTTTADDPEGKPQSGSGKDNELKQGAAPWKVGESSENPAPSQPEQH